MSSDLKATPCAAEEGNADPDLDLLADIHNLRCLGTLRYQVIGLQAAIDKYNLLLEPK